MRRINEDNYREQFTGDKAETALEKALDIRKFEIDLYWKRATYFWTLNAAAFAGYAAVAHNPTPSETSLLLVISCFGFVLSFGWYLVNRGSKQWQQNWEYHVDMLENQVIGPLYKTVMMDQVPSGMNKKTLRHWFTGAGRFSVSKVNIMISLFVVSIWFGLVLRSIITTDLKIPLFSVFTIAISSLAIILMLLWGNTAADDNEVEASLRATRISSPTQPPAGQ
jgi:hypothetical protein